MICSRVPCSTRPKSLPRPCRTWGSASMRQPCSLICADPSVLPGGVLAGAELGPVTGDDQGGEREQLLPAGVQLAGVGAEGVLGRAERGPPGVRAHDQVAGGGGYGGDVLGGVAGGAQQADRGGERQAVGVAVDPAIADV